MYSRPTPTLPNLRSIVIERLEWDDGFGRDVLVNEAVSELLHSRPSEYETSGAGVGALAPFDLSRLSLPDSVDACPDLCDVFGACGS